jgi:uncharacterized protein YjbI with pentapeptide repeats
MAHSSLVKHPSLKLISKEKQTSRANFQGKASFPLAKFQGGAWFSEANFQGEADFERAQFLRGVLFSVANFQGEAYFARAKFQLRARLL